MKDAISEIINDQPKEVRLNARVDGEGVFIPNLTNKNELTNKVRSLANTGEYDLKQLIELEKATKAKVMTLKPIRSLLNNNGR